METLRSFPESSMPNLIICGQYSILKLEEMPFAYPIGDTDWWQLLATSTKNPIYYLLEKIWTRLSYKYNQLPREIFGEDLAIDIMNYYIICRLKCDGALKGWEYNYRRLTKNELKCDKRIRLATSRTYKRTIRFYIHIGKKREIDISTDQELKAFVGQSNNYTTVDELVESLCNVRLTYRVGNIMKYLTDQCETVFLPTGKAYAAENKSGRLSRWASKQL